ncbi:MAG: gamma carbonic anhydrase family protein [Gammaproteobacteria bacterium RBG_16_57_12]|nr:MAG: gamma carbonic anhydrase family protein [Gammaproteobacteria bacterium RBG_16_57_12]
MIRDFQGTLPRIDATVYVDEAAVVIGDVEIGADSSIWPLTVVRGDVHRIRIGRRTNIQDNSVLHVTQPGDGSPEGFPLTIGDNVTVGHGVVLHACMVEDDCLIGMGSTILDGAVIHYNVLLGAGSLVPPGKELESGYLWLGNPVRRVRPLTDRELAWFERSAQNYVKLKNRYLQPGG